MENQQQNPTPDQVVSTKAAGEGKGLAWYWWLAILAGVLAFLWGVDSHAQTVPHKNTLNWVASASAASQPTLVYNVYKSSMAPGSTCPTAMTPTLQTLIATVGPNITTYVDSANLVDGGVSCYEVTAAAVGFESGPSNLAQAVTPLVLAAPSGLSVSKQ